MVIAIDETPVGVFVEIEGGEAPSTATARALGCTPDDYVTDSYRDAVPDAPGRARGHGTDMLFPEPAGE